MNTSRIIFLICILWNTSYAVDPDVNLDTDGLIKKAGYPSEVKIVETEDEYLLTIHRIPGRAGSVPVFLQHGLLGSSSDWVITGKGKSLAFILADLGYDVWMGNLRGNTYSRSHKNLTTSDLEFWNFSFHEMGIYDLPAMISYVTETTKNTVIYIGHSMGTTTSYVMGAERNYMSSKIRAIFSLSPVAFMDHIRSPLKVFAPFVNDIKRLSNLLGEGEFLPQNYIIKLLARFGCELSIIQKAICTNLLFVIIGFDQSQFNMTLLPVILSHTPAGSSTKTIIHYLQEINSGKFQQYDYGKDNMEIYNANEPPEYNLSKMKIPVVLFYAENDWLSNPKDVERLRQKLPNVLGYYKVDYPKFNHVDYLWAIDAPKLVYKKMISIMEKLKN